MTMPETGPLAGLDFTDAAWAKAENAGLTRSDFAGIEPLGKHGEYLVAQVEDVTERKAQLARSAERAARTELRESRWRGIPNFHCPHCPYASLKRAQVVRHIAHYHPEGE